MSETLTLGEILDATRPSRFTSAKMLEDAVNEAFDRMVGLCRKGECNSILIMYADGDPSYKGLPYLGDETFRTALFDKFASIGVTLQVCKPCQYDGWTLSLMADDVISAMADDVISAMAEVDNTHGSKDYTNEMEKDLSKDTEQQDDDKSFGWGSVLSLMACSFIIGVALTIGAIAS
ncbi:hypothetical protein VPHD528_0115 [Vibrio phage D528]